ncbi:hypothetical protein JCM11641_007385 [Rhodosporidiobolus odoratus]
MDARDFRSFVSPDNMPALQNLAINFLRFNLADLGHVVTLVGLEPISVSLPFPQARPARPAVLQDALVFPNFITMGKFVSACNTGGIAVVIFEDTDQVPGASLIPPEFCKYVRAEKARKETEAK